MPTSCAYRDRRRSAKINSRSMRRQRRDSDHGVYSSVVDSLVRRALRAPTCRSATSSTCVVMMPRLFIAVLVLCCSVAAEDWQQFLGPRRDGSYAGEIYSAWPKEGPVRTWQKNVGDGFAGPAVADGKVFIFHRSGNEEKLDCLEAKTGKPIWSVGYPATYVDSFRFDPGPRAVPTVAEGRVFAYGADGMISATEVRSGKNLWRIDAQKEFASKKGWFGRACSPLVVGDLVMINVGGEGAGIV